MRYIIIILTTLLASCTGQSTKEQKNIPAENGNIVVLTDAQVKNAGITTAYLTQTEIRSVIKANGKIDVPPQNMVSVSFPLGGYLKSTKLLHGMHVSKGEVIAVMEDQQYIQLQQDYLTAQARQGYLQNEYERQQQLNKTKASSDKAFQQAETDYKMNNILLRSLEQKLQLIGINTEGLSETNISRTISVRSPIDGYVSDVKANIGKYVTPSDVLFELVNPQDIHLALTIFEKDVNSLHIGQKLVAYTNNKPELKYPCEIILIGKDVSPERTILVHCHFDKYDHTLVPGMYMNADIEVQSTKAFTAPEDAIVRHGDKQFIFIQTASNRFEMKEVKTGAAENKMIAIIEAADVDFTKHKIVTRNAYTLLMKLKNTSEGE